MLVVGHLTDGSTGGPFTLSLTPSFNVPFKVFGLVASAQVRVAFNGDVATFTGPGAATGYKATIKWGDGTSSRDPSSPAVRARSLSPASTPTSPLASSP